MRVPLQWLQDYVDVSVSAAELAEKLTMSGSLVEKVENSAAHLSGILVARVDELKRVEGSDHLWLVTLDVGDRRQTVVTGAQNLFPGAVVPFIGLGLRLPGSDQPLKPRKLAGVVSEGMVCSGRELGINSDHDGILILDTMVEGDRAVRAVGRPLSELLGTWVLELEITPNRPDCLSMIGIAIEVAAFSGVATHLPTAVIEESQPPASQLASVRIEDEDLCRRLAGRVITGVKVGPSPVWLKERLSSAGIRSISNIVDITNFVMLEYGQPLHAYDLDALAGHTLVARRARHGEEITTLDGIKRALHDDMLVISDRDQAVGVAGIMGGLHSEIGDGTTRILLEAANFQPRSIRRASLALGLRSEASSRFEKGLPIALPPLAIDRAAALIVELAGGVVAGGMLDAGRLAAKLRIISFPLSEVRRLLGVEWTAEQIIAGLHALGFTCEPTAPGIIEVTVPWWREDVAESADLVEEVARIVGFDNIPDTLLRGSVPPRPPSPGLRWYGKARTTLLACGLSEGSSPGLTNLRSLELLRPADEMGDQWLEAITPNPEAVRSAGALFRTMHVVNPLTPDREYLRPTLLAGLLEALRDNLRLGEERAAFFELDNCSFPRPGELPFERRQLAIAMAGRRSARSWASEDASLDFFDLKGIVLELLLKMGIPNPRIVAVVHPLLHPGRGVNIVVQETTLGFLGELHPLVAARWDLGLHRPYVMEVDFYALADAASAERRFAEYPRLPFAKRDLAVVVDEGRPAEDVLRVIQAAGKNMVAKVTLFDVYRGNQVPEGKKSLACALDLQSAEATLREDEVDKIMGRIRKALQHQVGAAFRD
jgi:phenylalanyl-tRNA synthetase beta chain